MGLDRYEIIRELGQGTCGKTFLAKDTGLPSNRLCVIKQLKPVSQNPRTYEIIKSRFMVEARVLEKLGRETDRIPELYELVSQEGEIYLVQEWVEGKTIKESIQAGPFSATEVLSVVLSVVDTLRKLYAKGVIHRDINPNNIILRSKDGEPVLIDFGLVKEVVTTIIDEHGTPEGHSIIVGTRGYIAPEQAIGKPVFASDLYSLGMTAINMLTGKQPSEMMNASTPEVQWLKYASSVPSDFADVIEKATQPNYLHRYANAAEMFDAVRSCIKQSFDDDLITRSPRRPAEDATRAPAPASGDRTIGTIEETAVPREPNMWDVPVTSAPPLKREGLEDLAIELGNRTLIYREKVGIVVFEQSIVAVNKSKKTVEVVGKDVEDMLLLAEGNLEIVRPIKHGRVTDRRLVAAMLQHFVDKACGGNFPYRQRLVIAIPAELTQVERQAFVDAAYGAKAAEVYLVNRAACAVVGAHLPMKGAQGNMLVHVSEDATEILATSGGRQASFESVNVGSDSMPEAIRVYIKRKYNLLIGEETAAAIFSKLASAYPLEESESIDATGRNLVRGTLETITVNDEEVREAIADDVSEIINGVFLALERTPPQLSSDIIHRGLVLSGSGAQIKNLDKRLLLETGLPVSLSENPLSGVVTGAAKMLAELTLPLEKPSPPNEFVDGAAGTIRSAVRRVLSKRSTDLAIDIGSANVLVYAKGRGIVVSEPAMVAINRDTNQIEAFGRDAKEMLGRSSDKIIANCPMKDGAITDTAIASKMLKYVICKAHGGAVWVSPRVILTVPSGLSKVEHEALMASAFHAGASEVYIVDQALAAAIGAGLPITEPDGNMIVDIGEGLTEIAVISLSGIVFSLVIRVAGDAMTRAIAQYIKRKYNLLIGERTAEAIKIELGSAFPLDEEFAFEIRGRNLIEGIPKTITIADEEVREALADSIYTIINSVRVALERTPPELAADIVERGIVLTGGGALLKNFDKRLSIETGLPVSIAEDPLASVILGAGRMLSDFDLLRRVRVNLNRHLN